MSTIQLSRGATDALAAQLAGPLFLRGDDGLAAEAAGFNLAASHSPDVVVGAASAADVAAAVNFAAKHGLAVTVQATGHGAVAPITSGLLITTKRLNALRLDATTRIASIGAGLPWQPVVAAAATKGLAPITGSAPTVGAIGYTVGGGIGPLGRTFGFTSDYARGFEVVTADGQIRRADSSQHPDLFWSLRGGKGGLGIVTSMDFELVPLTTLFGGGLFFAVEHIEAALRAWVDWTKNVPDTVNSSVALIRFPPLDAVPAPLRGKTVLHLRYAFIGDAAEGARHLAPLRAAAPVMIDGVAGMKADETAKIHNDPPGPLPAWVRGMMLKSIDQDFVTTVLNVIGPNAQVPLVAVEIRHLGGAFARVPEGGDAVGGRQSPYTFNLVGAPVPDLFAAVLPRLADRVTSTIAEWISPETNVNFAMPFLSAEHYASTWPAETLDRLERIRAKYDPNGMFTFARQWSAARGAGAGA
jgi:FAD/FMN-containing dehydrogenase